MNSAQFRSACEMAEAVDRCISDVSSRTRQLFKMASLPMVQEGLAVKTGVARIRSSRAQRIGPWPRNARCIGGVLVGSGPHGWIMV